MNEILREASFGIFFISIFFICMSCVDANYGSIIPDSNVTKGFESFQMDPDMNYYFSGSDVYPNAIMGLEKSYVLDSDLWKPIEAKPKVFKELITGMQTIALNHGMVQHGFIIKDNRGQSIGVWYSILKAKTFVKMEKDNKVSVPTPDMMTYEGAFKG
jgi:hypothetical protein